jgi:hypothetical protein
MAFYRDIKYRASDTADIQTLDNITFDGSSSYSLTRDSAAFTPSGASNILLSIDGVVQSGNFTITGSTIDFGVNVPATSECDFILHLGVGVINTPADGSVTEAKIANGAVSLDKLSATGTKDSTTFLRGDNTFATVSTSMYPAFMASLSADTSIPNATKTKVPLNTEWIDTDSAYDNSTNYRFTVPSGKGGNYFVHASARCASSTDFDSFYLYIDKNGSDYLFNGIRNEFRETTEINSIIPLSAGDYIEMFIFQGAGNSVNISGSSSTPFATHFGAYRIGA